MSADRALRDALDVALKSLPTTDVDKAAVALAKHYADELDNGGDPVRLGPPYLGALESLGMTPRARAAQTGGKAVPDGKPNPLDELKQRRAARQQ